MFKTTLTEESKTVLEVCLKAYNNRKELYVNSDNIYIETESGGTVLILDNGVVASCGEIFLNKSLKSGEISKIKKEILDLIHLKTLEMAQKVKEIEQNKINQLKDCL